MAEITPIEKRIEPIRLRPHHFYGILNDLLLNSSDRDQRYMISKEYEKRFIENYISLFHKIKANTPVKLVPAFDDICAECSLIKNPPTCYNPEPDWMADELKSDLGITMGRAFFPLEILARGSSKTKEWLDTCSPAAISRFKGRKLKEFTELREELQIDLYHYGLAIRRIRRELKRGRNGSA